MSSVISPAPKPMLSHGVDVTLGMGCSRLGSLLAHGGADVASQAVSAAVECGIRFFDTADIYGQGSSEIILGRALPKSGVEICTKGGHATQVPLWALRAAKVALRPLTAMRGTSLRDRVAAQRARSYTKRFDVDHLSRSLKGSLARLKRDHVDVYLLHGPEPEAADSEELWRWVDGELARGTIRSFGVSLPGDAADLPWLDHEQLAVVQVPARSVLPVPSPLLSDPRARRLRVLVKELLGPGKYTPEAIEAVLRNVVSADHVAVALLGMSSPNHVRQAVDLFNGVLPTSL